MTTIPIHRKTLPHTPPSWVGSGSIFFITICGSLRDVNQFCHDDVANFLFESARYYNDHGRWWSRLLLLMPDHIHALISFPQEASMKQVVSAWKGYTAKQCGVTWQRDFFDHRIRHDESLYDKATYIRNNPVRIGLVEAADQWRYVWMPEP